MGRRVTVVKDMPSDKNLRAMEAMVAKGKFFKPAAEVLTDVRAVPTIFIQYDHANGVGGHIIERATVIHGPSNHGKTVFLIGLGKSFLMRDHFFGLIDAEMTTPMKWVKTLLGERLSRHPGFVAARPDSYEQTADGVRHFLTMIDEGRKSKSISDVTSAILGTDSVRKLVPDKFFEKVTGSGKGKHTSTEHGVDGFAGRGGQVKAGYNAAWLDELIPLIHRTHTSKTFIARETIDADASANDRKWGNGYKVGGGAAFIYDASLLLRIERSGWIYGPGPEGQKKPVYGERHRITIRKTKIASKKDKVQVAFFHTSNGSLVPEGFDTARDVLELGERFGVVNKSSSWVSFSGRKFQGVDKAVVALHADEQLLARLEAEVREQFADHAPIEEDEDD